MIRFIAIRLLRAALTVTAVALFAAIAMRVSGDPAVIALGPTAPAEAIAAYRVQHGLNLPLVEQILQQFAALLRGDFGISPLNGLSALQVVAQRVPTTLLLAIPALLIKVLVGIPVGTLAALRQNSTLDRMVMAGSVLGIAVPNFVIGLGLVLVFAVELGILPSNGQPNLAGMLMPVLTLALAGIGTLARFTRSSVLGVIHQPHVRTAYAKGLTETQVIRRHVLPNATAAMFPVLGLMLGSLLAGTVVVETLFSWPGVGSLLVTAVGNRDINVVPCILLLSAVVMTLTNVGVDVLQALRDPRILQRGR